MLIQFNKISMPAIYFHLINLTLLFVWTKAAKIKYREPFPGEHEGYLPDNFKQRLREIAQNEYLTGEARIDLVDKVYDKLPKTVLMKLPLDPPIYQLPPTTQKKFRALMVDRSLGWRRRAQLYDQLVSSLPKKYQKLVGQFATNGGKSSSSSSSSSADSGANDPEMEAAGMGGADMDQAGGGGGMSGGMGGGGMDGGGGGGSMGGGGGGGGGGGSMGGQEMVYDNDRSGIDYDKYISESSEEKSGSKGKPWSSKAQINKKTHAG